MNKQIAYNHAVELVARAYGVPASEVEGRPLWVYGYVYSGNEHPTRADLLRWADDGGPQL